MSKPKISIVISLCNLICHALVYDLSLKFDAPIVRPWPPTSNPNIEFWINYVCHSQKFTNKWNLNFLWKWKLDFKFSLKKLGYIWVVFLEMMGVMSPLKTSLAWILQLVEAKISLFSTTLPIPFNIDISTTNQCYNYFFMWLTRFLESIVMNVIAWHANKFPLWFVHL
jgi:hypothetical protein